MPIERKLAAIMSMDISGYTELISMDCTKAIVEKLGKVDQRGN